MQSFTQRAVKFSSHNIACRYFERYEVGEWEEVVHNSWLCWGGGVWKILYFMETNSERKEGESKWKVEHVAHWTFRKSSDSLTLFPEQRSIYHSYNLCSSGMKKSLKLICHSTFLYGKTRPTIWRIYVETHYSIYFRRQNDLSYFNGKSLLCWEYSVRE